MNPRYQFIIDGCEVVQRECPSIFARAYPRRIVPPQGYPNPKWMSGLLTVYSVMQDRGKCDCDTSLLAWTFIDNHCPTYFVGHEFGRAVAMTHPPDNMLISELQWPQEAIMFVLPDRLQDEVFGRPVPFLMVARATSKEVQPPPYVRAVNPAVRGIGFGNDGFHTMVVAPVIQPPKYVHEDYTASFNSTTTFKEIMSWEDFEGIEYRDRSDYMPLESSLTHEQDLAINRKIISLTMGLLIAMAAVPEYIENGECVRKARVKHNRAVDELWAPNILGRHYRQPHNEPQGGTHASPRMHTRAGHWRNQRTGKNWSGSKIIWIKPVLVCPDSSRQAV